MRKTLTLGGLSLSINKIREWNHGVEKIFTVLEVPEEAASSGSSPGTLWHCKMRGEMADGSQITTQILFCGSSMMNSIASSMASAASTNFRVHTGVSRDKLSVVRGSCLVWKQKRERKTST